MEYSFQHLFNAGTSPLGRIVETGLYPASAGTQKPRILDSYALVYCLEGNAKFRHGERKISLRPGDLCVLFPGIIHNYEPLRNERWSQFFIVFEGPVFDLCRLKGILDPLRPVIHLEPVAHWLKKLESVFSGTRNKTSLSPLGETCSMLKLLTEILDHSIGNSLGSFLWEAEACAILEADLGRALALADVAREVGVSYEVFRKQFVSKYGQSPGRYRTACRINRACALISDGTLANKKIAETLGFANEFHFSRRFKQFTGQSPTEFRRSVSRAK